MLERAEDKTMGDLFTPTHLIILAVVVLVLFGGKRLPELGKGMGEALKGFREGLRGFNEPTPPAPNVQQSTAPAPPASNSSTEPKQS